MRRRDVAFDAVLASAIVFFVIRVWMELSGSTETSGEALATNAAGATGSLIVGGFRWLGLGSCLGYTSINNLKGGSTTEAEAVSNKRKPHNSVGNSGQLTLVAARQIQQFYRRYREARQQQVDVTGADALSSKLSAPDSVDVGSDDVVTTAPVFIEGGEQGVFDEWVGVGLTKPGEAESEFSSAFSPKRT